MAQYLKTLVLIIFIITCLPFINSNCSDPQKGFFLSYNALSKRDTMADVFKQIDKNLSTFSAKYTTGDGILYELTNVKSQLYYNEHHQSQSFIDSTNANVSLGLIFLNLHFNYSITTGSTKTQGYAQSTVVLDEAYFTKRIVSMVGFLQWDPIEISPLFTHNMMYVKYAEPDLSEGDKITLQLILNEHVSDSKIKTEILADINKSYKTVLKKHLNNEQLIGASSIEYRYKNVTYSFNNYIKNFTLHDDTAKGLEVFFLFQLDGHTTNCTQDLIDFSFGGGVQEWYSLTTLLEVWRYSLSQGILNVKLDKKWEVPAFQLFAGDLANSIPFLDQFNAELPIQVTCKWTNNTNQTKIRTYDHSSFMTEAQTQCTINFQGKNIVSTTFTVVFTIRVIAQQNSLQFKLRGVNANTPAFKSLDPNYEVVNKAAASYSITQVLQGLVSSEVLGTGWKTSYRKFPSVNITSDYLIIFDPSER